MGLLDDLDLAILAELEKHARTSLSDLARRLGTPNSTIRDRIRRLEREEVILGYSAIIDHKKLGFRIKVIVQITRDQSVPLEVFLSEIAKLPEVANVQLLTGDKDELVTVYARDVEHLKDLLYNKFPSLSGVIRTSTAIVLSESVFPFTARHRLMSRDDQDG